MGDGYGNEFRGFRVAFAVILILAMLFVGAVVFVAAHFIDKVW